MEHLEAAVSIMQHLVDYLSAGNPRLQALKSLVGLQRLLFEETSDTGHLDEATCTTDLLLSQAQGAGQVGLLYNLCDLSDMRL